ncbi:hypothetical protein CH063_05195 [Colletotrichum higginsianum]|uniref:FACT complex subunit SPT16 N-terminal lobe domain-containing protein n=1 Tax=Colletotrichum higginsianum (strain IMI 349063) TaxID=759273 RepID=H1UY61_COLHI|nr:hypothetical protein CH063_05195 [Colletotrichum higginsianum]
MAEIKIDSKAFHERVTRLAGAWKNDLRSKDGNIFHGASSIVVMMGKVEETPELHKNNAMHKTRELTFPYS